MTLWFSFLASRHSLECVQELLKYGAKISHQTYTEDTALHNAAECGQRDILAYLLNHGADMTVVNEQGLTPLYITCHRNEVDCLIKLIEHAKTKGKYILVMSLLNSQ